MMNFLKYAIFTMAFALALVSCSNDDDEVNYADLPLEERLVPAKINHPSKYAEYTYVKNFYVSKIVLGSGSNGTTYTIDYDNSNKIVGFKEIEGSSLYASYTITYETNTRLKMMITPENEPPIVRYLIINSSGKLLEVRKADNSLWYTCTYENENMKKLSYTGTNSNYYYEHDNRPSLFKNVRTPSWFFTYNWISDMYLAIGKNNSISKETMFGLEQEFEFSSFRMDNMFPTKFKVYMPVPNNTTNGTITYNE